MKRQRLAGLEERGDRLEGGIQAPEAVERNDAARLPGCGKGQRPARLAIVGVAVRGDGRETVHAAAQDDEHEAALAGNAGEGDARQPQRQAAAAQGHPGKHVAA